MQQAAIGFDGGITEDDGWVVEREEWADMWLKEKCSLNVSNRFIKPRPCLENVKQCFMVK